VVYNYPNSIDEAAKVLDQFNKNWADKVDIVRLDMGHGNRCVLGQVFDAHDIGLEQLFDVDFDEEIDTNRDEDYFIDKIFGARASRELWIREIIKRKVSLSHVEVLTCLTLGIPVYGNGIQYYDIQNVVNLLSTTLKIWTGHHVLRINDLKPGDTFRRKNSNLTFILLKIPSDTKIHCDEFNDYAKYAYSNNNMIYCDNENVEIEKV